MTAATSPIDAFKPVVSEAERRARIDLAACYRLIALAGMDDGTATHITLRIPGETNQFLINPYGLLFSQVTASNLVKIDCEGWELPVLRGAEVTLRCCKPTVIVEQKPGRAQRFGHADTGAVDYLQSLGAKLRAELSGDYILSWS